MAKQGFFNDFLTDEGRGVLEFIKKHCEGVGIWRDEYVIEASMLADSLVAFREAALMCNRPGGSVQEVGDNGYLQVSVHYTIKKNEYLNILKHAPKFGLNPSDLKKAFGTMPAQKDSKGFNLTVNKSA